MVPRESGPEAAPLLWWWTGEDGRSKQVVVVTGSHLHLSVPLGPDELVALEDARRRCAPLAPHLGSGARQAPLDDVVRVSYIEERREVRVEIEDGSVLAITAPVEEAGVAAGVFEVLRRRLGGSRSPRREEAPEPRPPRSAAVAVGVGLFVGLLVAVVGWWPLGVIFAAAGVVAGWALRSAADVAVATLVFEVAPDG